MQSLSVRLGHGFEPSVYVCMHVWWSTCMRDSCFCAMASLSVHLGQGFEPSVYVCMYVCMYVSRKVDTYVCVIHAFLWCNCCSSVSDKVSSRLCVKWCRIRQRLCGWWNKISLSVSVSGGLWSHEEVIKKFRLRGWAYFTYVWTWRPQPLAASATDSPPWGSESEPQKT
jgi:hypothetical protein